MKFEHIRVMNFENAIRGMRHPKLSYHLSDSIFGIDSFEYCEDDYIVAERWYDYLNGGPVADSALTTQEIITPSFRNSIVNITVFKRINTKKTIT